MWTVLYLLPVYRPLNLQHQAFYLGRNVILVLKHHIHYYASALNFPRVYFCSVFKGINYSPLLTLKIWNIYSFSLFASNHHSCLCLFLTMSCDKPYHTTCLSFKFNFCFGSFTHLFYQESFHLHLCRHQILKLGLPRLKSKLLYWLTAWGSQSNLSELYLVPPSN